MEAALPTLVRAALDAEGGVMRTRLRVWLLAVVCSLTTVAVARADRVVRSPEGGLLSAIPQAFGYDKIRNQFLIALTANKDSETSPEGRLYFVDPATGASTFITRPKPFAQFRQLFVTGDSQLAFIVQIDEDCRLERVDLAARTVRCMQFESPGLRYARIALAEGHQLIALTWDGEVYRIDGDSGAEQRLDGSLPDLADRDTLNITAIHFDPFRKRLMAGLSWLESLEGEVGRAPVGSFITVDVSSGAVSLVEETRNFTASGFAVFGEGSDSSALVSGADASSHHGIYVVNESSNPLLVVYSLTSSWSVPLAQTSNTFFTLEQLSRSVIRRRHSWAGDVYDERFFLECTPFGTSFCRFNGSPGLAVDATGDKALVAVEVATLGNPGFLVMDLKSPQTRLAELQTMLAQSEQQRRTLQQRLYLLCGVARNHPFWGSYFKLLCS